MIAIHDEGGVSRLLPLASAFELIVGRLESRCGRVPPPDAPEFDGWTTALMGYVSLGLALANDETELLGVSDEQAQAMLDELDSRAEAVWAKLSVRDADIVADVLDLMTAEEESRRVAK